MWPVSLIDYEIGSEAYRAAWNLDRDLIAPAVKLLGELMGEPAKHADE